MLSAMPEPVLLSVVVPTRNEAGNVAPLVDRLLHALEGVAAEICFVDDSDDDTPALLERLEREHPGQVRCLFRQGAERAGGLSTAVAGRPPPSPPPRRCRPRDPPRAPR